MKQLILSMTAVVLLLSACSLDSGKTPGPDRGGTTDKQSLPAVTREEDSGEVKEMTAAPAIRGLEVPARPDNYVWDLAEPDGYFKIVFWDGQPALPFSFSADLEGGLWAAKGKRTEFQAIVDDLRQYYDKELLGSDWVQRIDLEGHKLDIWTIDGPDRYFWGYVKRDGDDFRALMLDISAGENDTDIMLMVAHTVAYDEIFSW